MNHLIFKIFITLNLASAENGNLKSISSQIPAEDAVYKYYLGTSDGQPSLTEAINSATSNAIRNAVQENFGFETQIQTDTYSTASASQINSRFSEKSKRAKLVGFERIRMSYEQDSKTSSWSARIIFRYSKIEISRELLRIDSRQNDNFEPASVIGGDLKNGLGGIEITTTPAGAAVFVEDKSFLESPILLRNRFQPGVYKIRIDHPNYETIEEKLIIRSNQISKIHKTLIPAKGFLQIQTEPSNADVFVNGTYTGKSPIEDFKAQADRAYRIEIRHPDAFGVTLSDVKIEKGKTNTIRQVLQLQSGDLEIVTNATDPIIIIDGDQMRKGKTTFRLAGGFHDLMIMADGFTPKVTTVQVSPNMTNRIEVNLDEVLAESTPTFQQIDVYPAQEEKSTFPFQMGFDVASSPLRASPQTLAGFSIETGGGFENFFITCGITHFDSSSSSNYSTTPTDTVSIRDVNLLKASAWYATEISRSSNGEIRLEIGASVGTGTANVTQTAYKFRSLVSSIESSSIGISTSGVVAGIKWIDQAGGYLVVRAGIDNFSGSSKFQMGSSSFINMSFGWDAFYKTNTTKIGSR